jgi:hypothetical protein
MARSERIYTDEIKGHALAVLDANGGNYKETERVTGISDSTIQEWDNGRIHAEVRGIRYQKGMELAEKLDFIAHELCDLVAESGDKKSKANLKDSLISLGIAVEKSQLLKGQPTSIIGEGISDLTADDKKLLSEAIRNSIKGAEIPTEP